MPMIGEKAVASAMKKIVGAYSLIVLSPRKMIGARDPFGFKPLCIGKRDNTYVMSSETCALDAVGAEFVRDVLPGEIVTITADGRIESDTSMCQPIHKKCIFEYIYGVIYYSVMCKKTSFCRFESIEIL